MDPCSELLALVTAHPWRFVALWFVVNLAGNLVANQITASFRARRARKVEGWKR